MPFKVLYPPPGAFSIIYSSSSPSCSFNSTTLVASDFHTHVVSKKEKLSWPTDLEKNKSKDTLQSHLSSSKVSNEKDIKSKEIHPLIQPSSSSSSLSSSSSSSSSGTPESTSSSCSTHVSSSLFKKTQSTELQDSTSTTEDLHAPSVPPSSSSSSSMISSSSSMTSLTTPTTHSSISIPSSFIKKRNNSLFSGMLKPTKPSTLKVDPCLSTATHTNLKPPSSPIPSYSQRWFIIQEEEYVKLNLPIGKWVGPRDVSFLKPMEIKRQETIFELISTERDYVRDLQLILKLFLKPIQKENLLTTKETQGLFANLEQLLPINQELLHSLETRRLEGHCIVYRIADVFLQLSQYFKMYTHYCMNYQAAITLLTKLSSTRSGFHKFLIQAQKDPSCQHLDLASFLLKPVQRLCKYPLLLKEILKLTPQFHRDELDLRDALTMLNQVVQQVNEGGKFREDQLKLLELHSKLIWNEKTKAGTGTGAGERKGLNHDGEVGLPRNPQRKVMSVVLVKQKTQGLKWKPRTLILLSDAVLLCKSELLSSKLLVRQIWLLPQLEFTSNEPTVLEWNHVCVSFETIKAKTEWYEAVQALKHAQTSMEATHSLTMDTPMIVSSKETIYRKASMVIPIKETKVSLDVEDVELAMQYLNHTQTDQQAKETSESS